MSELLQSLLVPILLALLTGLAGWLAPRVRTALSRQIERVENDALRLVLQTVSQVVMTAVADVSQTAVAQIKAAREDGKLTQEEARAALRTAVEKAWRSLGASARDTLLAEFGSEQAVKRDVLAPEVEAKVATLRDSLATAARSMDEGQVARDVALARQRIGLQP